MWLSNNKVEKYKSHYASLWRHKLNRAFQQSMKTWQQWGVFCWKWRLEKNENWIACSFNQKMTLRYTKMSSFLSWQAVFKVKTLYYKWCHCRIIFQWLFLQINTVWLFVSVAITLVTVWAGLNYNNLVIISYCFHGSVTTTSRNYKL